MVAFTGMLRIEADESSAVECVVDVNAGRLLVTADELTVGNWSLGELTVSQVDDGFRIEVEGERLVFAPRDPAGFAAAVGVAADDSTGIPDDGPGDLLEAGDDRGESMVQAPAWWRFWDLTVWRDWLVRRREWTEFRSQRRSLDREIASSEDRLTNLATGLDGAERLRVWAKEIGPREVPVKTARAETGLASVSGVSLLETRRREGRDVWTTVDHGSVHFTDRKLAFAGAKSVEFRYDKLTAASASPQGLHLSVSNRKRAHVLAGPVERLQATLWGCQAVANGGEPTELFDDEIARIRTETAQTEQRLGNSQSERANLTAPARPVSPGWIPAGLLALLLVLGGPFLSADPSVTAGSEITTTTAAAPADASEASSSPLTTVQAGSTTTTRMSVTGGAVTPVAPVAPVTTAASSPVPVSGEMVVWFFDVGQGDSTLIQGPDFTVLVDAGRHDRSDVVPYLRSAGVTSIDLLVGTHPHADHIGQFPQVLAEFPVSEVWMSGDSHTSQTFERALDAILASDTGYRVPRAGENYQIGSARVEVINPSRVSGDLHDGSISLRVVFGQVAFIFTGDAEAATEQSMVRRGHDLTAHVLQVGHHGSRTSTSSDLLRAVSPQIAVYSASEGNQYGHPHAEVIDRLTAAGVEVYGTAIHGTVRVTTNGSDLRVATQQGASTTTVSTSATTTTAVTASGCGAGRVDINSAGFEELQLIIHIGPDRAQQILDLRPFSSVDSMTRINGIGPARLNDIKNQGVACVP